MSVVARCTHCKSMLKRGWFVDFEDFKRLTEGESVPLIEVLRCIKCGLIAAQWDETLAFYEERNR